MNFIEQWFSRLFSRNKDIKDQDDQPVINYDNFPGIGHHLDYSQHSPDGSLRFHATLPSESTPSEISDIFTQLADDLLAKPPENLPPDELHQLVKQLRYEADVINPKDQ